MPRLSLYLLGEPRIERDGIEVKTDRRPATALLAYLAVTRRRHRRDVLIRLLWPGHSDTSAKTTPKERLRQSLSNIRSPRKAGLKAWIYVDRDTIGLNPDAEIWLDVDRFRKHLTQCDTHGHTASAVCPECIIPLTDAVSLYRGDFMSGFDLKEEDNENFYNWRISLEDELRGEMADALEKLVRGHSAQGRLMLATHYAERWLKLDPSARQPHEQLMRLYAWSDRLSDVHLQYEKYEKILRREGDTLPESTTALYRRILAGRTPQQDPGSIFLSHFVGREHEIREVLESLGQHRLVTLVAVRGIGKTRTALEVASRLSEKYMAPHGVALVRMADITEDTELAMLSSFVTSLNLDLGRYGSAKKALLARFEDKEAVLLLDGIEIAPRSAPTLIREVLAACPGVRVLATSQVPLGLQNVECTIPLEPMKTPEDGVLSLKDLEELDSFRLFRARADLHKGWRATDRNAAEIAEVLRLTDGIPLAIERASARINGADLSHLVRDLRMRRDEILETSSSPDPEQHASMQAYLDYTFDHNTERLRAEVTGTDKRSIDTETYARIKTVELPGGTEMEMVWIEPGTFVMGMTKEQELLMRSKGIWGAKYQNEQPAHEVTITRGFWLGKCELTQGQWASVIGGASAYPSRPKTEISWDDVQAFIRQLNMLEGAEVYRLPTEAEWEYACRAGTETLWSFGNDERLLGEYAWYLESMREVHEEYAHEVATKLPNLWGLYDMHGNVWEMCSDWYGYYTSSHQTDPRGRSTGSYRAYRGGGFNSKAVGVRSSDRDYGVSDNRSFVLGARLVMQEL